MFATLGYAVVVPDYYGFGVTKDYPQTYLCEETTARQMPRHGEADAKLVEEKKNRYSGESIYIGYSPRRSCGDGGSASRGGRGHDD